MCTHPTPAGAVLQGGLRTRRKASPPHRSRGLAAVQARPAAAPAEEPTPSAAKSRPSARCGRSPSD
eukprot:257254-Lingulodinium_polyedra.AAC.1